MKSTPLISVVMPAKNGERYIKESINSVIAQSMPDFELIIVNDGSTDNSSEIARSYKDKRVKVIDLTESIGCYPARNVGIKNVTGKYICMMDADDISLPYRLESHYRFLEEHIEFGMVYGINQYYPGNRSFFRESDYENIKVLFLEQCYLCHAASMVRASLVKKHDLFYNETYTYASDYEWQVRALSLFPVSVINELVYLYRVHSEQISAQKRFEQDAFADQVRLQQLSFFGIKPTETEKMLHLSFLKGIADHRINAKMIDLWIDRLLEANGRMQYYSQRKLQNFLHAHRYIYINQCISAD